jgi:protein arginine N-methyltransferase 6
MTQFKDEEVAHQEILQLVLEKYIQDPTPKTLNKLRQLHFNNFPNWHFPMMQDQSRLDFYQKSFEGKVEGKVILDVGAGGGLLSALALHLGARKVYAIERHPTLCTILKVIFAEQIKTGQLTIIEKDTKELTVGDFPEDPQVLIHEIFSIDGVGEGVLRAMDDLRRFHFWKDIQLLPHPLQLWMELISLSEGIMVMSY